MPYPTDITYPAKATDAAWQKKKGVLDKAHKTGVGPKLVAAEKAWKDIPFPKLDDSKNKPKNSTDSKKAWDDALAAIQDVGTAKTKLGDAITTVKASSTNKKLSSDCRKALSAILADLEAAKKRLALMDDLPGMLEIDHRNLVKEEQEASWELTRVELKVGSTLIAKATNAKRQKDGVYLADPLAWEPIANVGLDYLQKDVTVTGTDKRNHPFNQKMKLVGASGKYAKLK